MFFWNSLAFLMIQWMLAIEHLEFHGSRIAEAWPGESITFLVCEVSAIVQQFEHSLALPFLGKKA